VIAELGAPYDERSHVAAGWSSLSLELGTAAVLVHNLTKRFRVQRRCGDIVRRPLRAAWATALDGVDLEVGRGEVFGLLGPNGAGKTTLLKIFCTLLLPTSGRAVIGGYDVVAAPSKVRQTVGYCLDTERSFYYRLTGYQNLAFFATLNNLSSRERTRRILEVIEVVGLDGAADGRFMSYSKGMQQKLGLARALLTDPVVLLLDEPTKSLDPGAATAFRRFLRGTLAEELGKTILLVSHSLDECRECCDRMAIMDRGRILFQGGWSAVQGFMQAQGGFGRIPEGVA
jgi:ABC-2 type transport system ATP-binding protein